MNPGVHRAMTRVGRANVLIFCLQGQDAGYLVDSVEEMAVKVADLLTHEARRSELARDGRKLVEEKWTWVKVSEKYRELIGVV